MNGGARRGSKKNIKKGSKKSQRGGAAKLSFNDCVNGKGQDPHADTVDLSGSNPQFNAKVGAKYAGKANVFCKDVKADYEAAMASGKALMDAAAIQAERAAAEANMNKPSCTKKLAGRPATVDNAVAVGCGKQTGGKRKSSKKGSKKAQKGGAKKSSKKTSKKSSKKSAKKY